MGYKVYILWSATLRKFYVGSTENLEKRLQQHNSGQGKFTSKGVPWILVCSFDCSGRSEAMILENKIKRRGIERYLNDQNITFGK